MAIKPLSGLAPEWYTPKQDGEENEQTAWHLKPMDGMEYMEVMSISQVVDGFIDFTPDAVRLVIKYGLIGWRNFKDENGNDLVFNTANVRLIDSNHLTEIAQQIILRSSLSAAQKKT